MAKKQLKTILNELLVIIICILAYNQLFINSYFPSTSFDNKWILLEYSMALNAYNSIHIGNAFGVWWKYKVFKNLTIYTMNC